MAGVVPLQGRFAFHCSDRSQSDGESESLTLRSVDFRAGQNGDQRRDWEEEA